MNNKGQIDYPIATFVLLVIGLIIFAPIMLKIFTSTQSGIGTALSHVNDNNLSATNYNTVMTSAISSWDKVIVMCFLLAIILLIISSILIDTSPFWIILYIILNFVLILFAPYIINSADTIYTNSSYVSDITLYLQMTDYIRQYFMFILVGVMMLTGIIIYGKVFLFRGNQRA